VIVFDEGTPRNFAARQINGFLGRDAIPPHELHEIALAQIAAYGVEFSRDKVVDVAKIPKSSAYRFQTGFQVATASGRVERCRKLLFATGVRDELPDIRGVAECYGRSVHHCPYCDGWEHRDQSLLAVGSSFEAAAGLALLLRQWSDRVVVLANGLSTDEESIRRLRHFEIPFHEPPVLELAHRDGQLAEAILFGGDRVPADALFFNTSHRARSDLAASLGCRQEGDDVAATTDKQRTTVPGVFFAGDADGDVQFAIVAAAEGATAAVTMNRELHDEDTHFDDR
jgi:thioredoxin reductase